MSSTRRVYALALCVGALFACGKTVATVKLTNIGASGETPIALAAGAELGFAVHADKYSYSGSNRVMVTAKLLRAGAVVGTMTCPGFEFEGGAGAGCGATHQNSSCSMTVPAGGADAIRITTQLQNASEVSMEGLEVQVKQ